MKVDPFRSELSRFASSVFVALLAYIKNKLKKTATAHVDPSLTKQHFWLVYSPWFRMLYVIWRIDLSLSEAPLGESTFRRNDRIFFGIFVILLVIAVWWWSFKTMQSISLGKIYVSADFCFLSLERIMTTIAKVQYRECTVLIGLSRSKNMNSMDNKTSKIKSLQFFKKYIKRNIINKTAVANRPSNKK